MCCAWRGDRHGCRWTMSARRHGHLPDFLTFVKRCCFCVLHSRICAADRVWIDRSVDARKQRASEFNQSQRQAVRSRSPDASIAPAHSSRLEDLPNLWHCCYALLSRRSSEGIGICTQNPSSNPTLAKYNDHIPGVNASSLATRPSRNYHHVQLSSMKKQHKKLCERALSIHKSTLKCCKQAL